MEDPSQDLPPEADDISDEAPRQRLREPSTEEVITLADQAFMVSDDWWSAVNIVLKEADSRGPSTDSPAMVALRHGLRVVLREQRRPGRRPEVLLEPLDFPVDGHEPTRPRDASPTSAELWRQVTAKARHPATRARFHDLLVLRGGRGTPDSAAAAAAAYVELARLGPYRVAVDPTTDGADPTPALSPEPAPASTTANEESDDTATSSSLEVAWRAHSIALAIGRAISLAPIALRAPAGAAAVAEALALGVNLAEQDLADPMRGGRGVMMLELVGAQPNLPPATRAHILRLADQAVPALADRPWLVDRVAEVILRLDSARVGDLERVRVEARVEAAAQRPAAARLMLLEEAAALALRLHRPDLADPVTRQLQAMDKTALGLVPFRHSISIPAELLDTEIEQMSHGADWRAALESWLNSGSPAGDPAAVEETVRKLAQAGGLRRFLPTVLLGAGQLPRWRASSEADEDAHERARVEQHHIQLAGHLHAEALDRIGGDSPPSEGDLITFLDRLGAGNTQLTAALARALCRYWNGDFEGTLHTAVPRIEAAARALVLELDQPAYQVATRASEPGKYVGLGVLLSILDSSGLDPAWERFLRTFLTGPIGMNVRNDVAHGFVLRPPSREMAALALRGLALLVLLLGPSPSVADIPATQATRFTSGTCVDAIASLGRIAVYRPDLLPERLGREVRSLRRLVRDAVCAAKKHTRH